MDILERYNKEYPEVPQGKRTGYNDVFGDSEISQWLIRHSGGYIKNGKQANYILAGFLITIILTSLFLIFDRNKFSLTPEEKKLFIGKTAAEKLLVPQQRDQSLFNK